MSDLLIIDAPSVRKLLTMPLCMDAMKAAAVAVTRKAVTVPLRRSVSLHDGSGSLLLMPGSSLGPDTYGAKLISLHAANVDRGLPVIQGFISLFDHGTGAPIAIIHGAALTAIRTAAASGMATQLLARKDVQTHGIFGAGVQASTHAAAVLAARPNVKETIIWARNEMKAEELANKLSDEFNTYVRATNDKKEAARCDVVTTVSGASSPLVFGKWLTAGAHLNIVGAHTADAREVDTQTILNSAVYVETVDTAFKEAGDLIIPEQEGVFSRNDIAGEIGDVLLGNKSGRESDDQITLYKSLGNAAQDIHAGWAVYREALDKKIGVSVPF
ncbi:ornithine cyclodeaminase family protein [Kordiimonas aquimaris]|uniref:ornithine cyclodeaminase family protein n=1 Tax=Kordiimonas aquimaris TaxID=707591 RepID=UPI0021D347AF|nr:hypothetical protein [Kordiimonas aquimaris]